MSIALIDKDMFASLLRYGKIVLPEFQHSETSAELPIEDALRVILESGNPIEYPSHYIIVAYDNLDHSNELSIKSIKELIATDTNGFNLFSTQFRKDLVIQPGKYSYVFDEYLNDKFLKESIRNGIIAFRTLCGLESNGDYSDDENKLFHGIMNRVKYHHHYELPPDERIEPYSLMVTYDRHSPYLKGLPGYICDVIEVYCYHSKPNLGFTESIAETTGVYSIIKKLKTNSYTQDIVKAIKEEKFTHLCNDYFYKPGGYLVPYFFFFLRDILRKEESFYKNADLVDNIKKSYAEPFEIACNYIGGFFGYQRFYEDYYSSLNLPFLSKKYPQKIKKVKSESENRPGVKNNVEVEESLTMFVDGTPFFNQLYRSIGVCLQKKSKFKSDLQTCLYNSRYDDKRLEEIYHFFLSTVDKRGKHINELLGISKYEKKQIEQLKKFFKSNPIK